MTPQVGTVSSACLPTFDPPLVLFELRGLCCSAREYLYVTALELVCSDYLLAALAWIKFSTCCLV